MMSEKWNFSHKFKPELSSKVYFKLEIVLENEDKSADLCISKEAVFHFPR